ncbi:hypothetical protein RI103_37350 (plasmid) [Paraburkholderia sp. FT54]|uniref:hypothetical protein n=1 Tax=Paraburkholderia sp. FT54 TaxID=3074437 RepID=UPI002877AB39|nr:hypothetical protein [Paraburkholderia sp. FT54]WNC95402.1 hypothetical protein RI103_37350 [Paraburkholderia sp. FT54]
MLRFTGEFAHLSRQLRRGVAGCAPNLASDFPDRTFCLSRVHLMLRLAKHFSSDERAGSLSRRRLQRHSRIHERRFFFLVTRRIWTCAAPAGFLPRHPLTAISMSRGCRFLRFCWNFSFAGQLFTD